MVKCCVITRARKEKIEINVADIEHVAALLTGGILIASGYRRRGVGGTLMKMAGLGMLYRGQKGYAPVYRALGLHLAETPTGIGRQNATAVAQIRIHRSPSDLYRIWRNFENLAVIMDHLISVHEVDDEVSEWVARAPLGTVIKWKSKVINDIPDGLIAWETLEGSGIDHAGSVHFDAVGEGVTRVRIKVRYDPPADALGIWLGKQFHVDPQRQIERALFRFKEIMEVGRAIELENTVTSITISTSLQ